MRHLPTIGTRCVVTVEETASVVEIVSLMHDRNVGSVVVVRAGIPVGIITDRDIVLRVLHRGKDPQRLGAKDVMTSPVATISEDEDPLSAATIMRERQVRRLPVLRADGSLAGILTLDDLSWYLARTHQELSEAVAAFPPIPHTSG